MKDLIYKIVRGSLKGLLHLYFGKIIVKGQENVTKNKAVLYLSNHQNAFLDTILIGTDCGRNPFFLTRASVFKNRILKSIFIYFKMIPIYRIRDGISLLKNNEETFRACSQLLIAKEALVIFPEGNHHLKRRVRPLSKGFTRILFAALEQQSCLDIYLVPVGVNYRSATKFPDRAAIYYGKPIRMQEFYRPENLQETKNIVIKKVSDALKTLTTHIENDEEYDLIISKLVAFDTDFLHPEKANTSLMNLAKITKIPEIKITKNLFNTLSEIIFFTLNLPVVLLWRQQFKPKIKEQEFISTFRFAFSAAIFPIYYLVLFVLFSFLWNMTLALLLIAIIFSFNLVYTKLS